MRSHVAAGHIAAASVLSAVVVLGSARNAAAQSTTSSNDHAGPAVLPPATATAFVHIDSLEAVSLEVERGNRQWWAVCSSPCDAALSVSETYRINGRRVRTSEPFLIRPGNRIVLKVDPASTTEDDAPVVITAIGVVGLLPVTGVTALVGFVAFLGVFICPFVTGFGHLGGVPSCIGTGLSPYTPLYLLRWVWIPALGGAALVTTGGTWRLLGRKKTSVTQTLTSFTLPPPTGNSPAWETPEARMSAPMAVTFPILDLQF
jgi:hypothetical protein